MEDKDLIQKDKFNIIELIIEDVTKNNIQISKNHNDTLYLQVFYIHCMVKMVESICT